MNENNWLIFSVIIKLHSRTIQVKQMEQQSSLQSANEHTHSLSDVSWHLPSVKHKGETVANYRQAFDVKANSTSYYQTLYNRL